MSGPRYPVPGTDGYVRQSADAAVVVEVRSVPTADARDALEDHAEDCPA